MKKAVILAAGVGSRLAPITNHKPKSMVRVAGMPILEYQIKGYLNAGLKQENIYILTGYKKDVIETFIYNKYPRINLISNNDFDKTNNMYSLYMALNALEKDGYSDEVFINNADCIYSETLMRDFVNCSLENAIAIKEGVFDDESMKVVLDSQEKLVNIAKTIKEEESHGISLDLYKYSKRAVTELHSIIKNFIEVEKDLNKWTEVSFPILFKKESVQTYNAGDEYWVEVDNNDDLLRADNIFSEFNAKSKKAIALDLDGTVYLGNKPINTAVEFIEKNKDFFEFYFISNNTSKTPEMTLEKLKEMGVNTDIDHVINPLHSLVEHIKQKSYKSIYLVANNAVTSYLKKTLPHVDFSYNFEENQSAVICYDNEVTYSKLENLSRLLNKPQRPQYIATHSDIYCPSEYGNIPDIGAMTEMIKTTIGVSPDLVLGKPNPSIMKPVMDKYSVEEIAYIGDRLYTDKKLADAVNCDFVCVLTGEASRGDVEKEDGFPALIIKDLSDVI